MTHRGALLLLLLGSGCVNDYVVRDDAGDTSTSTATTDRGDSSGASTGGGGDHGGTAMGDATQAGTAASDGSDSGGGSLGDTTGGSPFSCQSCSADTQCGDDFDNCVDLGAVGPRCVISCPEAGCGQAFDCALVVSVDGVELAQCVPLDPQC